MRDYPDLSDFVSASIYTKHVDQKKLRFIFSALTRYAASRGTSLERLRVLEIACGDGGITLPLASLGCRVTAFDIDAEAVGRLRARIDRKEIRNVTLSVDNGFTFDDGHVYDVIIASEVFEHVLEPSRLAENIMRRMMPGSYLVVTTPNGYGPYEMKNRLDIRTHLRKWDSLRRLIGKPPYVKGNGADHCQYYTKEQLLGMFSRFNLKLIDFAKSDSLLTVFGGRNTVLGKMDIKLADWAPHWLASGWYLVFEAERSTDSAR